MFWRLFEAKKFSRTYLYILTQLKSWAKLQNWINCAEKKQTGQNFVWTFSQRCNFSRQKLKASSETLTKMLEITRKPCSQPSISFFTNILGRSWEHEPILVFASNWDWRTKDSQLLFLERTCRRHRLETTTTTTLSKKPKISASKNLSEDGIGFHQNKINVNIAMIT